MTEKSKIQNPKSKQGVFRTSLIYCRLWRHIVGIWTLGFWIFFTNCAVHAEPFLESFLKDGIGARPLGMGGAFTAQSDDSNAVYYNPAGLAFISTHYAREYMDMNSDIYNVNEGYSISTNQSGLAVWSRHDKNGKRASVSAFSFGTGGENGVSWGITYKNISWGLPQGDDRGSSIDVGLKAPLLKDLTGGILLQDFLKNNIDVASSMRLGISFVPSLIRDSFILIDGELRNLKSPNGATVLMHYGAETKLSEGLILRGGWEKDHFTAGATFAIPFAYMDYAVIINRDSKNLHMFNFKFSEKKPLR